MRDHDIDEKTSNGEQRVQTYVIAYNLSEDLLKHTAGNSNRYFMANNSEQLSLAFEDIVSIISNAKQSFISTAIATNSFNNILSQNNIYYSMFKPENTINWKGNIKRYHLNINDRDVLLTDVNGMPAIDTNTGAISENATSFWSSTIDGADILHIQCLQ